MKLRPLHDRVVVRRVKEEEKTKGGIIIPDTAKEKPQEGEIVAVGNGAIGDDNAVNLPRYFLALPFIFWKEAILPIS